MKRGNESSRTTRVFRFVLAVGFGLLLVELAARLFWGPPEYLEGLPYDPEFGFRSRPGVRAKNSDPSGEFEYRLNDEGFRGPDLPGDGEVPPPGTQRWMFLGDSFLDGWLVPEESLLPFSAAAQAGRNESRVEGYNVSNTGFGTGQELLLLQRYGERVAPDVVVLVMFTGNDFADDCIGLVGRTLSSPGGYVRPFFRPGESGHELEVVWMHPWRARLRRVSRLFQRLELEGLRRGLLNEVSGESPLLWDQERLAAGLVPRPNMNALLRTPEDPWSEAWPQTALLLRAMQQAVNGLEARFLVVVIPHVLQVQYDCQRAGLDAAVRRHGGVPLDEALDWNLPEERLAGICDELGIASLFLSDALREETKRTGRSMYLSNRHLNARGHELAGRLIAERLATAPQGSSAKAAIPAGSPVDVVALTFQASSEVDFAAEMHPELLGFGWLSWFGAWGDGECAGWGMEMRARLGVVNRSGVFELHGWLPKSAPLPLEVRIQNRVQVLSEPGFFVLSQEVSEDSRFGSVRPIHIETDRGFGAGKRPMGMIVRGIALR